ncbi:MULTISPECIES: thiamine ABC transporter substrate-binding protein [Halolamina]|uniref:thiamine ABC transporter substrate-binding protein n=1 Tax=Halolamina TaxID=1075397 RepID=UPI0009444514|nr:MULTISPECIES: thiamine ABC transporter substrate-binding protein [Halolamina]NHX37011.1 thiamine ABC transporter substrate-binding protein [Halolamina sp. R1-12]
MDRRRFIQTAGAAGVTLLAGCSADRVDSPTDTTSTEPTEPTSTTVGTSDGRSDTLVVATYSSFIDAVSTSPGAWIKQQFESEFDADLVWQTPPNELDQYIQRANAGVEIDADVYVGLNVDGLIRLDDNLESGSLFAEAPDLDGAGDIKEGLQFDPQGRAVTYDTGYISLVWNATADGGEFVAPETFDGLLESEYAGDLLAQNPSSSATGRAFLLHTIQAKGEENYLDYWADLQANDVRILDGWDASYSAYGKDEAPMVVSYSTDQVYANRAGQDMDRHQIRFLNDQAYANPEGMARFAGTDSPDLAQSFMEFMLRPEVQAEIAVRNVAFPAVTDAEFGDEHAEYEQYAQVPPEAVSFTYDELRGNLQGWIEEWSRQIAGN